MERSQDLRLKRRCKPPIWQNLNLMRCDRSPKKGKKRPEKLSLMFDVLGGPHRLAFEGLKQIKTRLLVEQSTRQRKVSPSSHKVLLGLSLRPKMSRQAFDSSKAF